MSDHNIFVRRMQSKVEQMRAEGIEPFKQDATAAQEQGCQMPYHDEAAHDAADKSARAGNAVIANAFIAKLERTRRQVESAALTLCVVEAHIHAARSSWQEQRHQEDQAPQAGAAADSPYAAPLLALLCLVLKTINTIFVKNTKKS